MAAVCPVDYKAGSPKEGEAGLELWDTDRMQLGLQCLILRDNGYACDEGIIYYRGTKQRVRLEITPDLEAWIVAQIAAARITAQGAIPAPLVDSPKCRRCSLAPVCLPDETRMLSIRTVERFPIKPRTGRGRCRRNVPEGGRPRASAQRKSTGASPLQRHASHASSSLRGKIAARSILTPQGCKCVGCQR